MNSHNVVSLFTNAPIKDHLWETRDGDECINLSLSDIMDLLSFILSTTYFGYGGKIYQQIQGTPKGSPVSMVMSDLYMEIQVEHLMEFALCEVRPKIWKRYVENAFEIVKKDQRDALMVQLNQTDHTDSIQFTDKRE